MLPVTMRTTFGVEWYFCPSGAESSWGCEKKKKKTCARASCAVSSRPRVPEGNPCKKNAAKMNQQQMETCALSTLQHLLDCYRSAIDESGGRGRVGIDPAKQIRMLFVDGESLLPWDQSKRGWVNGQPLVNNGL